VGQDEVHLVPRFVAPVAGGRFREMGLELFQNQMLPERAAVVRAQRIPAACKTHEASVEGINLGLSNNFIMAAAMERSHHRDGVGYFQRTQMAFHGRPGDA